MDRDEMGELITAGNSVDGVHYQIRHIDRTYVVLGKYEHACADLMLRHRNLVEDRIRFDLVTPEMHANGWVEISMNDNEELARQEANNLTQNELKREWFLSYSGILLKAGAQLEQA